MSTSTTTNTTTNTTTTSRGDKLLLTPGEVAVLFRVDPRTVTRWAKAGKLPAMRTIGGHRRYLAAEVNALITGSRTGVSVDGGQAAGQVDGQVSA